MRDIIPIGDREQRMSEGGRIRLGIRKKGKGGKEYPSSIDTFRFTSHDRTAIEQIADAYGGTARPWTGGHGDQHEVITEANEVRIVLPPDPIMQAYELWSGGGCQRRCNGTVCEVPSEHGMRSVECICVVKDEMECKPKTRLNVILPDIKFGGVWRLETSSWNALDELRGFVDTIASLQERGGLTVGLLALEQRQTVSNGQTKNYVVPTLRLDASVQGMLEGLTQINRLAGPQDHHKPALEAPSPGPESPPEVDSVTSTATSGDSTPPPTEEPEAPPVAGEAAGGADRRRKLNAAAHARFGDLGWDYEEQVRPALKEAYDGRTLSKLTDDELRKLLQALDDDEARSRFEEYMPYVVVEEGAS